MSHFVLFSWILIHTFIVHTTSQAVVRGVIGQTVELPCFYRVKQLKDLSDMCWGRGPCPNSKCNNKILHTTGSRVTYKISQRYSLRGSISKGDVSLTIGQVKAEDAGTYCCRIEIPGLFNDIKKTMRLQVVRAPPVTTTTTRRAPVSPKHFRTTTFAPQATSDHQTTAETGVLLTTTAPPVTTATTESTEVIALETTAVTANDVFPETMPETMATTSALPDSSTGFQAIDMMTGDYDYMFYPSESVPLPGDTNGISASSNGMAEKHDDIRDKFPSYAILITCLTVVPVLFILMLSLFVKPSDRRRTLKKFSVALKEKTAFFPVESSNITCRYHGK